MSNFVSIKVGGWAEEDPLTHDEINLFQEQLLKAPNLTDGSTHAPTAAFIIGGAGIQLAGTGRVRWRRLAVDYNTFGGSAGINDADILDVTDMDGAARDLVLVTTGAAEGVRLTVNHAAGAYILTIKQGASTLCALDAGGSCEFFFDGTNWVPMGETYAGPAAVARVFSAPPSFSQSEAAMTGDGDGVSFSDTNARRVYFRERLASGTALSYVRIWLKGQSHGTWPPDNMPTLTVSKYDPSTDTLTQLGTIADASDQSTYEALHAVTVTFSPAETLSDDDLLIARIQNESGTNAVSGLFMTAPHWAGAVPVCPNGF